MSRRHRFAARLSQIQTRIALALTVLLALALPLAGCGGPASTVFRSAAPTDAIVPYIADASTGHAAVGGLRGKDGTEAWRKTLDAGGLIGSTAVSGGTLYFGNSVPSTPSALPPTTAYIAAIRVSDGKQLWRTLIPSRDAGVTLAADGTTVIAAADSSGLYALNAADGLIRWHNAAATNGAPHLAGEAADGVVVVSIASNPATGSTGGNPTFISGVRESDGTRLWQQTYDSPLATNQFAAYTTIGDGSLALSPEDGHELWSFQSGRTVEGGGADNYHGEVIAVGEQLVLVQESFPVVSYDLPTKDYLAALDARTGRVVWKSSPGLDGALSFGGPLIVTAAGTTTIYGAHKTDLVALRGADGTQLWRTDLAPYTAQQIASADGVVFALAYPPACDWSCWSQPTTMRMEALDGATGATYWQRDLPDALVLAGE